MGRSALLLHFGAVDWEATVWINGKKLGDHRGGYDGFTFDMTDAIDPNKAEQELIVGVYDPTDAGTRPAANKSKSPAAFSIRRLQVSGKPFGSSRFRSRASKPEDYSEPRQQHRLASM